MNENILSRDIRTPNLCSHYYAAGANKPEERCPDRVFASRAAATEVSLESRQTISSFVLPAVICRAARPSVSASFPPSASAPLFSSSSVLACSLPGSPRPSRWWVQSDMRKLPIWDLLWLVWSNFDRRYNEHMSKNCLTSIAACANDHKSRPYWGSISANRRPGLRSDLANEKPELMENYRDLVS